jgi:NAD(P)-dependent dehydrogenase (short-subunit alcohol dehydrogenase family)
MTSTLSGTVAVVTGASSGIGAATARRLADRGACVATACKPSPPRSSRPTAPRWW